MTSVRNDTSEDQSRWAAYMAAIANEADRTAFQSLFDHFAPRVKSFMLRSGLTESSAEEIAQETLLTVWHKAAQYKPERAAVSTWIFTVARNKKIDRLRKDSRPLPDVNDPTFSGAADRTPEEAVWASTNADKIHQALRELPDNQREVLLLAFIEDIAHGKISERLGIPLGTVKSRIRLGLERLRSLLSDHRGDFS